MPKVRGDLVDLGWNTSEGRKRAKAKGVMGHKRN
jgi:hypothetical protein